MKAKNHHVQNKPHTESKEARPKTESTNRHVYVEPGVQIDLVEDLKDTYQSSQAESTANDHEQLFWTKVASVLLLATAIFTVFQIWQTRNNFRKDQRPYVWVMDYIWAANIRIVEKEPMSVSIAVVNYGKSPALHLRTARKIFVGPDSSQQANKWFDGFNDGTTKYEEGENIVPPGVPADPNKAYGYTTAFSDNALSRDDVGYILGTDKSATIVFRFRYVASFGGDYWSEACFQRQKNGAIVHCRDHNSADE